MDWYCQYNPPPGVELPDAENTPEDCNDCPLTDKCETLMEEASK